MYCIIIRTCHCIQLDRNPCSSGTHHTPSTAIRCPNIWAIEREVENTSEFHAGGEQ